MSRLDHGDMQHPRGIIGYFASNLVAANLIMGLLLVGGLVAGLSLNSQIFPSVDPGIISVSVPYPGATPTEVEEGITRRAEEAVFGIEGVERVVSTASENFGSLRIELKDFVDPKEVQDDIEAAIDQIADFPPGDAEAVDIVRPKPRNEAITLVVYSDLSEDYLRQGAEHLEQTLLDLPSVTDVGMLGARGYEIAIEVSEDALRQYGLTIDQIASAVRNSSLNLSSGELKTDAGDLLLRTNTKRESGEEFRDIVVRSRADGSLLRLHELATIRDGFVEQDFINRYNGKSAVLLTISASENENLLAIADEVKTTLSTYEPLPGVSVEIWVDFSEVLADRLSLLVRNGIIGFMLVFLFLVVMLDLRLAIWVAMGVPISFLGAFLFFDALDVNLNMVSLFALIIVLGIVVDDAVVVGENIVSEHEAGHDGYNAAILGVKGVLSPVTIGVLTTMAAFAPLLFVTGTFGQILGVVPVVVIAVLAMSLIEAFFILPAHLAHGGNWSRWPLNVLQAKVGRGVAHFRDNMVVPAIRLGVRFRYVTLLIALTSLVGAGALLGSGAVRFIFFPSLEADAISVDIAFPVGTPFETTRQAAERVIAAAHKVNDDTNGTAFKHFNTTIGGQTSTGGGPGGGSRVSFATNQASIAIQLHAEPLRTLPAGELERRWRAETGEIPGVESLSFSSEFFGGGPDLQYELTHVDDEILNQAVEELKAAFDSLPSVYDVQDSFDIGKRQYDIELTPAGEAIGLTPAYVARQLRWNFFGEEVQRIQRGREELKVMVRFPEDERSSANDLYNARIRLPDGTETPLANIARLAESQAFSSIDRVDGRKIVTVNGEIDTEMATPTEINGVVLNETLPALVDKHPGLNFIQSGVGEQQTQDLAQLSNLMTIALLVIFAMLAAQLRSYVQPLIILMAVPFGFAGAVYGHYALGFTLSFVSIFGMIALSGVVVNDSLILIDRYNRFRRDTDMSTIDAIVAAAQRRFRAIILTTATTALGLTPMLFETSIQAQFLIPMAVSLATGIVFSSVVILFIVPVLVMIREDFRGGREPAEAVWEDTPLDATVS